MPSVIQSGQWGGGAVQASAHSHGLKKFEEKKGI
jgi:hypothetical protein